jgi:hypothetical protein
MRVTVYVEGGREYGPAVALPPPNEPLAEDNLGPAHVLVRRCLADVVTEDAIQFLAPLKFLGKECRGSMLLKEKVLRRVLTWAEGAPDLAVVLVDEDGINQRLSQLNGHVASRKLVTPPVVVGVPAPEFEAWLLADHATAARIVGRDIQKPPDAGSLSPRDAKRRFDEWMKGHDLDVTKALRVRLASECDLALLDQCRSFELFRKDLKAAAVIRPR